MLGFVIGTDFVCEDFLEFQKNEQIKVLNKLTKIAKTSHQTFMPAIQKEFEKNSLF